MSMVALLCPFCEGKVVVLHTSTPAQSFPVKCPSAKCRRRLHIYVTHADGRPLLTCKASKLDAEKDGKAEPWDLSNLDSKPLSDLRAMLETRREALSLTFAAESEDLGRLSDYIRERGEASRKKADAYAAVGAAADKVEAKRVKADDYDGAVVVVLTKVIKKRLEAGKLDAERASKLLGLLKTEMGCRKVAEEFNLDL